MTLQKFLRLVLAGSLLWTGNIAVQCQLQFPGRPMGDVRQMKAADAIYLLPPVDPLEVEAALLTNAGDLLKPFVFALEREVDLSPETQGSWTTTDRYRIWRVHVISPGALSLGVVFNPYRLEKGVKVFVFDPGMTHVRGAYTNGNNKDSEILPVGHIPGDELIIEMQVPSGMMDFGEFHIESLSHAFLDPAQLANNCPAGEFGCSQACEIDVNCQEGEAWTYTKRSVVRIFTTTQYCTGVLINNSAYDGTPYVLTAEHCINKPYYADRSLFQFNYESPSCFGGDGPLDMSIAGCDTMAVGDSLDFSLVRLSLVPSDEFDVYYAGWDRSDFQTTGTTTIHHPYGDVKKISFDFEAPSKPVQPGDVPYSDLDDYHYFSFWWIREWDVGSTEGGSSGCPLFNADQKVIGTLTGGQASCGDSIGYDAENDRIIYSKTSNYDDYFTRLGMAWDYPGESPLAPWLDPLNSGVYYLGGYLPVHSDQLLPVRGNRFALYPNPADQLLFITSLQLPETPCNFAVYNLSGLLQISGNLDPGGRTQIPAGHLAPGVYMVKIGSGTAQEVLKLMIVR